MYSKYGEYENSEDATIARELLAKYKEEQKRIEALNTEARSNRYQYNAKQYPLPYNKYNIDKEKQVSRIKAVSLFVNSISID